MLEVPWLAVELREWFASHRLTFPCSSIIILPSRYSSSSRLHSTRTRFDPPTSIYHQLWIKWKKERNVFLKVKKIENDSKSKGIRRQVWTKIRFEVAYPRRILEEKTKYLTSVSRARLFLSLTAGAGTRCMSLLSSSPNLFLSFLTSCILGT